MGAIAMEEVFLVENTRKLMQPVYTIELSNGDGDKWTRPAMYIEMWGRKFVTPLAGTAREQYEKNPADTIERLRDAVLFKCIDNDLYHEENPSELDNIIFPCNSDGSFEDIKYSHLEIICFYGTVKEAMNDVVPGASSRQLKWCLLPYKYFWHDHVLLPSAPPKRYVERNGDPYVAQSAPPKRRKGICMPRKKKRRGQTDEEKAGAKDEEKADAKDEEEAGAK